jgi:transposase-like protein
MSQEKKVRKFSREFREGALRRFEETANISELCRELGISRQLLYQWRERRNREQQKQAAAEHYELRQENARLRKLLATQALEVDFFKLALQKIEAPRRSSSGSGATASGKRCGK